MIAESPRVRMSVLGIVVFALFAALFARLYYLQIMATDQYQVAAQANRIRVVPVEAPAGRILDRDGIVLVDNRISVQVTIDRTVRRRARRRRAHRGCSPRSPTGWPGPAPPRRSSSSRRTSPTSATARTCRCRSPTTCPRTSRSGSTSTAPSCPGVAAERVAVRHYPYGQLAAHVLGLHRPDHRRGVRGEGRLRQAVHAQRRDREVRRREGLRGRPARHAGLALDRGRRREQARSASSSRSRPDPR